MSSSTPPSAPPPGAGYLRIREFSQRVGVSAERLRAWERRYDLLSPQRSSGGFRLYSDADIARVQRMLRHLEHGVSAAQAARMAREETAAIPSAPSAPSGAERAAGALAPPAMEQWISRLRQPLERYDDAGAQAVVDELFSTFTLETALREVVLPCLAEVGRRWQSGEVSIAQEHFASNLLRGRLLGLAKGWGQGAGPRAVLATPPGELHDLGLVVCGLALSRQGVGVVFLGADCPIDTLASTVEEVRPAVVLLSATDPQPFHAAGPAISELAARAVVYLGGPGASPQMAAELGAVHLGSDPLSAAIELARAAATAPAS